MNLIFECATKLPFLSESSASLDSDSLSSSAELVTGSSHVS